MYRIIGNCLLALLQFSPNAAAHNFQEHWFSVTVNSQSLRIKATPPIEQFLQFDENKDGLLSLTEIQKSKENIQNILNNRISVRNEQQKEATFQWKNIGIQQQQLSIHLTANWEKDPTQVTVRYDHQDHHDIVMYIRRGQDIEQRKITPESSQHYHVINIK
jgi:hypothetical protein